MQGLSTVSLVSLLIALLPTCIVLWIMQAWALKAGQALLANLRMLAQLLAVGYVLTFVFATNNPWIIVFVIALMMTVSAWIAIRPLRSRAARTYLVVLLAIGVSGLLMLAFITQVVLSIPRWFEPRFVVPIAGMIFANAMNTISLAAERYESERSRELSHVDARTVAMEAALIPQVNALLAVGLVSLPGMMTGQILSGVDPLVAVRYQIVVMCMLFGSSGLSAAGYLVMRGRMEIMSSV